MKISFTIFSSLEYVQRHVSPFFKANSSLARNIFGFPDVSVFNASATPLITICRYSNLIFVHVLRGYYLYAMFPELLNIVRYMNFLKSENIGKITKLPVCWWKFLASLNKYQPIKIHVRYCFSAGLTFVSHL